MKDGWLSTKGSLRFNVRMWSLRFHLRRRALQTFKFHVTRGKKILHSTRLEVCVSKTESVHKGDKGEWVNKTEGVKRSALGLCEQIRQKRCEQTGLCLYSESGRKKIFFSLWLRSSFSTFSSPSDEGLCQDISVRNIMCAHPLAVWEGSVNNQDLQLWTIWTTWKGDIQSMTKDRLRDVQTHSS